MPDDILETTDETTTTDGSADETATGASPADDALSPADSSAEGAAGGESGAPEETNETDEQQTASEKDKAARIKAAEEEERRAEEARKERLRRLEQAEREERLAFRERELQRELERVRALQDELERRAAAVKAGGMDALKALGVDYAEWTKKVLEETGPEAAAQRALRRVEELEQQLKQREEADRRRAQEEEARQARERFEHFVDSQADDYPDAATLPPRVLHMLASEVAQEYYREFGTHPSFGALLPRLDAKAREFHTELQSRSSKRAKTTSPSNGASPASQASPGRPATAPEKRTLDPAAATTKASPPRQMTPEEEDEWALNELRQALAADAKRARLGLGR